MNMSPFINLRFTREVENAEHKENMVYYEWCSDVSDRNIHCTEMFEKKVQEKFIRKVIEKLILKILDRKL